MSITNERAAEVLRMIESDSSDDPTSLILYDEESAAFDRDYTPALQAGAAALTELTRLRAELAAARHEIDNLTASVRGKIDRLGEKHRENDALRAELAELRKPVEVLSEEVEVSMKACLDAVENHSIAATVETARTMIAACKAHSSAILKFANERGGGRG